VSAKLCFEMTRQLVATPEEAESVGFRGSPTVLVGGEDPLADHEAPTGSSCLIYANPAGRFSHLAMLRTALTR
jgi:hypothetical protein